LEFVKVNSKPVGQDIVWIKTDQGRLRIVNFIQDEKGPTVRRGPV